MTLSQRLQLMAAVESVALFRVTAPESELRMLSENPAGSPLVKPAPQRRIFDWLGETVS